MIRFCLCRVAFEFADLSLAWYHYHIEYPPRCSGSKTCGGGQRQQYRKALGLMFLLRLIFVLETSASFHLQLCRVLHGSWKWSLVRGDAQIWNHMTSLERRTHGLSDSKWCFHCHVSNHLWWFQWLFISYLGRRSNLKDIFLNEMEQNRPNFSRCILQLCQVRKWMAWSWQ